MYQHYRSVPVRWPTLVYQHEWDMMDLYDIHLCGTWWICMTSTECTYLSVPARVVHQVDVIQIPTWWWTQWISMIRLTHICDIMHCVGGFKRLTLVYQHEWDTVDFEPVKPDRRDFVQVSHVTAVNESCYLCKWVMSFIYKSYNTYVNEWCYLYTRVIILM